MVSKSGTRNLLGPKITARLTPGDMERLFQISRETGLPMSFIVRKAVNLYLQRRGVS